MTRVTISHLTNPEIRAANKEIADAGGYGWEIRDGKSQEILNRIYAERRNGHHPRAHKAAPRASTPVLG